jgi:hypothetical protein
LKVGGVIQLRMNNAARVSIPDGSGRALTPRPWSNSINAANPSSGRNAKNAALRSNDIIS